MRKRIAFVGAIIGTTAGIGIVGRSATWRTWGIDPLEANEAARGRRPRPGPECQSRPASITIDAPPAAVWPWLVQMGYGRGGWYSYDQLDMRGTSATKILPEYQAIAVGDIVPTVADDRVRRSRGRAGPRSRPVQRHRPGPEPGGSRRGRHQGRRADECPPASPPRALPWPTPQDFAASWAFVLEPLDGGRTRLIERFRVRFDGAAAGVPPDRPGHGLRRLRDGAPPDARHPRSGRADGRRAGRSSGPRSDRPRVKPAHGPRDRPIGRARARG